MGIAAWSYGTGSTTSASHPFSLTIQGIDVIDSVPRETIRVSTSLASNATMEFVIEDRDNSMLVPPGYSDMLFAEHAVLRAITVFEPTAFEPTAFNVSAATVGEDQILFSGLVIATEITTAETGRLIGVRCVDYGILLDRTLWVGDPADFDRKPYIGVPIPNPITRQETTNAYNFWTTEPGRVLIVPKSANGFMWALDSSPGAYTIRSIIESARIECYDTLPTFLYVDPQRRLNFWTTWVLTAISKPAPYNVVNAISPGTGNVAVEHLQVINDHTAAESSAYLNDLSDPSTLSGFIQGSRAETNGYLVGTSTVNMHAGDINPALGLALGNPYNVSFDSERTAAAWYYLSRERGDGSPVVRGSFDWMGTANWEIADTFTITDAGLSWTAEPAYVYSASAQFLGGSVRRWHIEFGPVPQDTGTNKRGGPRGSATRSTRTLITQVGA